MAFGEVKVNLKETESKLKIFHKHLGNMLEELEKVCSNCGSTNTNIRNLKADNEIVEGVRECTDCETSEFI